MSVSEPTLLPNGIKSFIVDLREAALPADGPRRGIPEVYDRACIGCSGPGQYWILLSDAPNDNDKRTLRMLGPLDRADRVDLVQDFVLPKDTHLLPPSESALANFWLWDWSAIRLLIPDLIRRGIVELHTKVLSYGIVELTHKVIHPKDRNMPGASLLLASSEMAYLCFGCYEWEKFDEKTRFKRCGGCRARSYCSEECQRKHWQKGHKKDCKVWAAGDMAALQCHLKGRFAKREGLPLCAKQGLPSGLVSVHDFQTIVPDEEGVKTDAAVSST